MRLKTTALKLWAVSLLCVLTCGAKAQQAPTPDALFQDAQQAAQAGKYSLSRSLARQVLEQSPTYTDAALLIGNTYAWEQKYDSAQLVLEPLLVSAPQYSDVYLALAKVALWSGQNPEVILDYSDRGLALTPASVALKEHKIKALAKMHRFKEAYQVLETIPAQEPAYQSLQYLLDEQAKVNNIRAGYQHIAFSGDFDSWQQASVEYGRLLRSGSITGRINYASRFGQEALQAEADYWPQLNEKTYLYLNAGFSNNMLFPAYRAGLEVYRKMPAQMEVSLGSRALLYKEQQVWLYTGHVGKYFDKYWVAFRPFVQQHLGQVQTTGILQFRRYLKDANEHLTLSLAKGSTPATLVGLQEISRLDANRISLEGNFKLGNSFYWNALLQYEREEIAEARFRSRYTTGLSLQYRFK